MKLCYIFVIFIISLAESNVYYVKFVLKDIHFVTIVLYVIDTGILQQLCVRNSHIASNQDTFGRAKTWVKELQRQASPNIVIALAGNKADLANKRMVEYDEAQAYAEENSLLFMETSAKTAMNVNDIFLAIGKEMQSC